MRAVARRAAAAAARFAAEARDLLFPPHCPGCGGGLPEDGAAGLCASCRADLPLLGETLCPGCGRATGAGPEAFCASCRGRHAYDAAIFAAAYAGTARELVQRFKYRADFAAGEVLGRLLAPRVEAAFVDGVDLLVPVPLHRRRLCARGFNQAAVLARSLGRRLGRPVAVAGLRRARSTRALAGLRPEDRARELRDAFETRRPALFAGRRVLLVDDILTTGTTADGCCRALKRAGAIWTGVAVAARALPPLAQRVAAPPPDGAGSA